jgi:hypothetical protein
LSSGKEEGINLLLVEDNYGDVALVSAALKEIPIPVQLSALQTARPP